MIHFTIILRLLLFPSALMAFVQATFSGFSLWLFHDHVASQFFYPAIIILIPSLLLLKLLPRLETDRIHSSDAMFFAVATWVVMGVLGAIPVWLVTGVSFTDSVFESISALTTTGATVLSGLDTLPKTFLMYRQFLQWLGGLGVVIFVVAILPLLNVGGMKLLRAETPGPIKDEKLAPRTMRSAHNLWLVYVALTASCAMAYYLAGMNVYDAIAHSFTTVSTGGFSTHDASLAYFNSLSILWVANLFMIFGAVNFAIHYRAFHRFNWSHYWRDEETRVFLLVIFALSSLLALELYLSGEYPSGLVLLTQSTFHLISFITSTGYGAGDFSSWSSFAVILLVVAGYQGGCAGSTAGGNKIIRMIVVLKLLVFENKKLLHPNGVFTVMYQGKPVEPAVISAVVAFFVLMPSSVWC